ncbi:MAG TPA: MazG nucleotide pyrophosphohydrolase domain-containing protein [Gaiellaceae bacterium]
MEFADLVERALAVRRRYAALERGRFGREWTGEELMLGFVKDVGDLSSLVQAREGIRHVENVDTALAHELADCLWSLVALADRYGVDLEQAFAATMEELDARLA